MSIVTREIEILLVEDNPIDAKILEEHFSTKELPHNLHVVRNGEAALAFLYHGVEFTDAPRPDVVLLDLQLPEMSGFEVLAAIKQHQHLRDIPVIVLTASVAEDDVRRAYELQANCYLQKPQDEAGFTELVNTVDQFWLHQVSLPTHEEKRQPAIDLAGPGIGSYDEVAKILPTDYVSLLNPKQTQRALFAIKQFVEEQLCRELNLMMVTVPLIVDSASGINDLLDRDGSRLPVQFHISNDHDCNPMDAQVVQAATKWKRMALRQFDLEIGEGICTDMRAVRKDYFLDHDHSAYVDQWDWELRITPEQRTLEFLTEIVNKLWAVLKAAEAHVQTLFPQLVDDRYANLPEQLTFVHAEDLLQRYPNLPRKERETELLQEHPAVFIYGIGYPLANGYPHEMRAADYDDWVTETTSSDGQPRHGLNGDILVWNPVTKRRHELSSMGIRVDAAALRKQLDMSDQLDLLKFPYHQAILNGELPLSIGGGIGQSRVSMLLLKKAHIGEVSVAVWPTILKELCAARNIHVLQ